MWGTRFSSPSGSSASGPGRCAGAILLILLTAAAAAADFDERRTLTAEKLTVRNLVGEIRVEGHAGRDFEVVVHVRGEDATPDRIAVEVEEGEDARLSVVFPVGKERRYVYPALGRRGKVTFTPSRERPRSGEGGIVLSLWDLLRDAAGKRLTVSGSGRGLEVWADVTIRVPAGASLAVYHGVGDVRAGDVEADLLLDSHGGDMWVDGVTGAVTADTGSGDVEVRAVRGAVRIDTGSGDVAVADCDGETIHVDTGSGRVALAECEAVEIHVDTGSGNVLVETVAAERMLIDTGSGDVKALALSAGGARVDTGSGDVRLHLRELGDGRFDIDTGSGGVELVLPRSASARVKAETGSGDIELDLGPDHRVRRLDRDEASIVVGDGDADVHIDTGGGSIRLTRAD